MTGCINTKLYVPVATLLTQNNKTIKIFKRTITWNKYQSKLSTKRQNQYSYFLIDPSFQGIKRVYVFSFENKNDRTANTGYYLPEIEIKNYNVKIDGKNVFDQPISNGIKTYENTRKIGTGQGYDYTIGWLLHYSYFKDNYKIIAINSSKQQALDTDPRAIQQINFTGNLDRAGNTTMFFIIEEPRQTVLDFSQETVKVF